ncbi:MAG: class I SAM-dependent methyltransferase [Acidimicrobiales bacterium]
MNLHEIGRRHGTDKCDDDHSFRGESYLHIYDRYLSHLREAPVTLLELGVKTGASLRMWREYFPLGQVHGVDLNPACAAHESERIAVHILSQDDEPGLDELAESVGGFDIVLDDCSHINALTLASERILFRHVKPGGFYIIEDLGMSWMDYSQVADQEAFMDGELAMNVARGVDPAQQRDDLSRRFEEILFRMDMLRGDVRFLHFWPNIAIAQKCAHSG